MPRIMVTLKLTEDERALLKKRAEKQHLKEAEYFRMTMVLEAFLAGDVLAVKILGQDARERLVRLITGNVKDAPVTA